MVTPLSWIRAYVPDLPVTDKAYCDAMTMSGTKVEGYRRLDKNLEKIVVGEVLEIHKHPDAEHLVVAQVSVGDSNVQIVTGAANVRKGDKVPVVLDGGRVAASAHEPGVAHEDGIKIKSGKLRGIESCGMMCSIGELGVEADLFPDADPDGIYILGADAETGSDAVEYLGLRDCVVEYEITSNRPDCYSVLGIAREAAATFDKPFILPSTEVRAEAPGRIDDYIKVRVDDTDLCPRYCARLCVDVKLAPSPIWMQQRLRACGIRPINNLVDITNYVMEEYGQPMHAFDYDTVRGGQIVVRRAESGEVFTTLDGQERVLDSDMLMICDGDGSIGIAGIMGGENSKITDHVHRVLFEAATFNGANIRKSAKRLGLRTEASGKFEKGLDPYNAEAAINRACELMEELGCGCVVPGMVDVHEHLPAMRKIPFEPKRYNALLGTDISEDIMMDIFRRIEVEAVEERGQTLLAIPSFRQDLVGRADIAEEIARFYGYDNIPTTLPQGEIPEGAGLPFKLRVESRARDIAEALGYSQAMCYSFESPKVFDRLLEPADARARQAITIANPLGEDFSIMRTLPVNGILTSLATNYNHRAKSAKLYELGNVYIPHELPLISLPDERMQLTLGSYGSEEDFYTLKGAIDAILEHLGITGGIGYANDESVSFLHPGRQAIITVGRDCTAVGYLGEVHPTVCAGYGIGTRAYIAVLDMPAVTALAGFDYRYEPIAKFPAINRDIALVVPGEITSGEIMDIIKQRGGKILESCSLFDVYEGDQVPEGYKSLAYSLSFRAKDRTLEDADVTAAMKKIMNGLEQKGVTLRS